MKALVSRDSHRPDNRYSGVYHNQGAMVTDADLDERAAITKARTDNLGDDTVKDGVPAVGGAVTIDTDGKVFIGEGVIYADGVRGVLAAKAGTKLEKPLDIFTAQADLPFGPSLPSSQDLVIYADIWERPVFPLEEPYLADPGLHGAITGFRTRTMVQLKAAPADAAKDIEAGTGAFPRIGTGRMEVTPLNADILADDCDPCAEVVSAEQQVANALWRLEVIAIEGTPENPGSVVIAWSEENAAEIAPAKVSAEVFERANKIYEFFSPTTEARAGVYPKASDARLSAFVDDLSAVPSPAKDYNGKDWPFVRRWDGSATVDTTAGSVMSSMGGGFELSVSGTTIKLRVTAFDAELDLKGAAVVPGDYWLVEMRRHAPKGQRIRLVKETPVGILHHYCTLVRVKEDQIAKLTDAERRKLSFPVLPDLPADHVGFDNTCEKLYGDAENVQDALDKLCSISADDIAFEPDCAALYGDAKTVQQALDALCRVDFSVRDSFRAMFDWGVLCGIVPKLDKVASGQVTISAGAYLDRAGQVTTYPGQTLDLSNLRFGRENVFDSENIFSAALSKGEVCLALAAGDGGKTSVFLVPKSIAFGPADPGFAERVKACAEKKKIIVVDDIIAGLPARQKAAATKMLLASSGGGALRGSAKLTRAEFADAGAANDAFVDAFSKVADEDEIAVLKQRIEKSKQDNLTGNLSGSALEVRLMQQATAVYAAISQADQERLRRCLCENLFPTCPPDPGKAPHYVPIACLRGAYSQSGISLAEVCPYCCRKQAMTWRALQYFVGDMRDRVAVRFAKLCCAPDDATVGKGLIYDPKNFATMDFGRFAEDYRLADTFLDRGERLPSDYVTEVAVNDLSAKDATATLKGIGVEVVDTIDVDDPKAIDTIQAKLTGVKPNEVLLSAGQVRPGDKVGLLVQDGVARGYVLLERGSGKLPFDTAKAAVSTGLSDADLKRAEDLVRNAGAAREDLSGLEKTRDSLRAGIESLKSEAGTLEKERTETDTALKAARDELVGLQRTRETLSAEIVTARKELQETEASHDKLVEAIRNAQPVNAVVGNDKAELVAKLAGEGIVSIGDIAKLNATQIRTLDRTGVLKQAEANELKASAQAFLRRPTR